MRNKVRSTEERLKRLAVQSYKGYTPFKLNEQIVEDDVTITHENLNIWGKNPLHGKSPLYLQENHVDKESSLLCGLPQVISILRLKV